MKQYDVTALGELLIDFTDCGVSERGNPVMEANPGGAPCNVLSQLVRLGHSAAFIGKVGADMFGRQLRSSLCSAGIETAGLVEDGGVNTTLAFVKNYPDGDRDFSFYRKPGADMMLKWDEVNTGLIDESRIFHFGTLSMTSDCAYDATVRSLRRAKGLGRIISFDPNIREPLWDSPERLRSCIGVGLGFCDVLKISDNELEWFCETDDLKTAALSLMCEYDIKLVTVSLGKNGSMAFSKTGFAECPALEVNAVDTTGAGDCFCACILSEVLKTGLRDFSQDELRNMLNYANTAAAIVTTRKGALAVMPTAQEISVRI